MSRSLGWKLRLVLVLEREVSPLPSSSSSSLPSLLLLSRARVITHVKRGTGRREGGIKPRGKMGEFSTKVSTSPPRCRAFLIWRLLQLILLPLFSSHRVLSQRVHISDRVPSQRRAGNRSPRSRAPIFLLLHISCIEYDDAAAASRAPDRNVRVIATPRSFYWLEDYYYLLGRMYDLAERDRHLFRVRGGADVWPLSQVIQEILAIAMHFRR